MSLFLPSKNTSKLHGKECKYMKYLRILINIAIYHRTIQSINSIVTSVTWPAWLSG